MGSVLITKSGDRMRFGCQIWGPKDEVNYVNDGDMLDLPEKSVKHKKNFGENMLLGVTCSKPSLKVLCVFGVCFQASWCLVQGVGTKFGWFCKT